MEDTGGCSNTRTGVGGRVGYGTTSTPSLTRPVAVTSPSARSRTSGRPRRLRPTRPRPSGRPPTPAASGPDDVLLLPVPDFTRDRMGAPVLFSAHPKNPHLDPSLDTERSVSPWSVWVSLISGEETREGGVSTPSSPSLRCQLRGSGLPTGRTGMTPSYDLGSRRVGSLPVSPDPSGTVCVVVPLTYYTTLR